MPYSAAQALGTSYNSIHQTNNKAVDTNKHKKAEKKTTKAWNTVACIFPQALVTRLQLVIKKKKKERCFHLGSIEYTVTGCYYRLVVKAYMITYCYQVTFTISFFSTPQRTTYFISPVKPENEHQDLKASRRCLTKTMSPVHPAHRPMFWQGSLNIVWIICWHVSHQPSHEVECPVRTGNF